jgi:hypothetical protein
MSVDRAVTLILEADLIADKEERRKALVKILSALEQSAWHQGAHEASEAKWWS